MMRQVLLCISLFLCVSSHSALLNFNFIATVTDIDGVDSASFGTISTGEQFSGFFIIDTTATPHAQSYGGYFGLAPSISFNLGGELFEGQSAQGIVDSYIDGSVNDFIQFSGVFAGGNDVALGSYQFTFGDRDANAIGSPDLLNAPTDLTMARFFDNSFDVAYGSLFFNQFGNSTRVNFSIDLATSIPVPVPAALWLLLSGLGIVGIGKLGTTGSRSRNPVVLVRS